MIKIIIYFFLIINFFCKNKMGLPYYGNFNSKKRIPLNASGLQKKFLNSALPKLFM